MHEGGTVRFENFIICILIGMGLAHRVEAFRMFTVFFCGIGVLAGAVGTVMALLGAGGLEPKEAVWTVMILVTSAVPIALLMNCKAHAEFDAGPI